MSRLKAALSLYVALAVHLLLILLLALAAGSGSTQLPAGAGSGLGGGDAAAPVLQETAADDAGDAAAAAQRARAQAPTNAGADSFTLASTTIDLRPKPLPKPAEAPESRRFATRPTVDSAAAKTASAAPSAPAGSGSAGGGRGGYAAEVRAHLSRHRRSLPGVLTTAHSQVAFSIAADGGVSDVRLVESSGIAVLDQEALALMRRATPFPKPPDGKPRRLSVPVSVEPPKLR